MDFDHVYTENVDAVYKYLYRRTLVREIAEDLTSITFMKALESFRSFDPNRGAVLAWLYRIARNALIDHYRTAGSRGTVDIESIWDLPGDDVASLAAENAINADALHAALKDLSPLQREIVMLRVWGGLSYKEISKIIGKSEGNTKVIFSRTLSELRTKMPALLLLLLFPHLV
jgi:RNA polymerase sigma-70 factor (ECF subfamily)